MKYFPIWKEQIKSFWKKEKEYLLGAAVLGLSLSMLYGITWSKTYAEEIQGGISEKVVRLHVLANSDDDADQKLKLRVRDRVLGGLAERLERCTSKQETLTLLDHLQTEICALASAEVIKQGYDYPVSVSVVREEFPEKQYGQLVFPAGVYDALRIEIGKAEGHNWWCVMYPQMCYVDAAFGFPTEKGEKRLAHTLTEEEYLVVSALEQDKAVPKIKLKLVEWWQRGK